MEEEKVDVLANVKPKYVVNFLVLSACTEGVPGLSHAWDSVSLTA